MKEEDHTPVPVPVDISTCVPTEVSKLDAPAVKRPPARHVAFGTATGGDMMNNATTGGFDQEGQDDKEEEMIRREDRDKADGITEEVNDGLQNDDDEVNEQETNASHLEGGRQKRSIRSNNPLNKSFEERLEELKVFREKHGHVRVTAKRGKSLAKFCTHMRSARRGKGTTNTVINEDRITALDELGFDWEVKKNWFKERTEELKAFKEKHGHVRVTVKHDKSLGWFCTNMRSAGRGKGNMTITEDRIKALNELGFEWAPKLRLDTLNKMLN